jgi:hypothetical protein
MVQMYTPCCFGMLPGATAFFQHLAIKINGNSLPEQLSLGRVFYMTALR